MKQIRWWGLVAKAAVYAMIGVLTLLSALDLGGEVAGKNAVLDFLDRQIFGRILVSIMAVGLIAYAVWRLYAAGTDAKDAGSGRKGYLKRIGYAFSGLIYGTLGLTTLYQSWMSSDAGGNSTRETLASDLIGHSWGEALLYLVAAILFGVGIYQLYKGWTKKFMEEIDSWGQVESRTLLEESGRIGFVARGVTFVIFAWFVVQAVSTQNADAVRGLNGAFQWLRSQSYGEILMGTVAFGLAAYGVYQYFLAKHSQIKT